ncbi:hypothetical protein SKAU_G00217480 [Synaphobranchus kaupii]|uniref:Uncharacterized protein n=1 Tax=Synaphobranchus kaupii TaxID=118154 RepID=A0A9Q1IVJ3_SYNKA|nr:hypothetical protein SKAU_G00217480 [Synaphobranchus kaupii]
MAAFPIIIVSFILYKVVCPHVLEKFEDYPCPDEKQGFVIVYKPKDLNISKCEENWDFAEKSIATHNGECSPPCLQVFPGGIRLTACINVTLNLHCSVPGDMLEEVRVYFRGKPSSSQGQRDLKEEPINNQEQNNYHIGLSVSLFVIGADCIAIFCFLKWRTRPARPSA